MRRKKEEGRESLLASFIGSFIAVKSSPYFTASEARVLACVGVLWRSLAFFGLPWFRGSVQVACAPCAPMWVSSVPFPGDAMLFARRLSVHLRIPLPSLASPPLPLPLQHRIRLPPDVRARPRQRVIRGAATTHAAAAYLFARFELGLNR